MWFALSHLAPQHPRETRTVLLRQGDPPTHVLMLCAGSAAIVRRDARGHRNLLAVRGAGELLGELALLDGGTRSATVIAAEPCQVRTVPAPEFKAFVEQHGLLGALAGHSVSRIRENEEIRQELATAPVSVRLAAALLRLADASQHTSKASIEIKLTQEELAQLIGASRNSVVQALAPWRAKHWVHTTPGGGMVITELERLRRTLES
ncbi:Crp/Fnr family transcriptional regulator [Streptomyces decoyicus]